ncbi:MULTISPECIES: CPBP family intramembrane glutamic endopeptidase [unclassified Prochlorococcus]|uniref:CPBP family intramembrane glutamic endopeptidase n=1 Tax=unclassified Prochlorococcus TaxID=2627481 RepID=UPI00068B6002|nr:MULTISPECIES: CPBP family intramembrane glutamic endopeptidase [unclassified Prochlorococcus]
MQPTGLFLPGLPLQWRGLLGTLCSAMLFLVLLPGWVRARWISQHPWRSLGITGAGDGNTLLKPLLLGLAGAGALLLLISVITISGHWGYWLGDLSAEKLINAVLLCLVVGLLEELIFRGWLWGELKILIGARLALPIQALIFSLVHTRFNIGIWPMLGLLSGLFLLGLGLAIRRHLDHGSLWGCVGLHGGLVGGWFALQTGLIQFSPQSPLWLTGPGDNPLGGVVGILAMASLLVYQLTALAKAARPITGARRASSKGATP